MRIIGTALLLALLAQPLSAEDVSNATEPVTMSASVAPRQLEEHLQSGTLLFSRGDCLAVRVFTQSNLTHVAVVVCTPDGPMVYDSMNGVGVRQLSFEDYLRKQSPDTLSLYQPCRPMTAQEVSELEDYLQSELGRPYSVTHHLSGKRTDGIHCAEYVTDALMQIGWLRAECPPRVSPASLALGIEQNDVYCCGPVFEIATEEAPPPKGRNRCEQLWIDTKVCTAQCCAQLSRWFLCR